MAETTPNIQPVEGKTTIDEKLFFEPERLSYRSARNIARRIAEWICSDIRDKTVVIAGTSLLADFANLSALHSTMDALVADFQAVKLGTQQLASTRVVRMGVPAPTAFVVPVAPAVTGTVSAVLGLASLFRQDTEFRGERTEVDSLAFELALAAALKEEGAARVFVPDLFVVDGEGAENSIRKKRQQIHAAKGEAWTGVAPFTGELAAAEADLEMAVRRGDQPEVTRMTTMVSELRRDMEPMTTQLTIADARLREIEAALQQRDEKGLTMIGRMVRAESMRLLNPVFVHAAVVSSGGHHKITRSLLRTLFWGDGLSFIGGAIVRWGLLKEDGSVEHGGIETVRLEGRFPTFWSRFRGRMSGDDPE